MIKKSKIYTVRVVVEAETDVPMEILKNNTLWNITATDGFCFIVRDVRVSKRRRYYQDEAILCGKKVSKQARSGRRAQVPVEEGS